MTNRDILDELRVRGELAERLERMAPRYREIITLRYGLSFETGLIVRGEMTLEQVAKLYSITNERLRQIEKKVFKDLSKSLTDSPWQTGTPTEKGDYLLCYPRRNALAEHYEVAEFDGRDFVFATGMHQVVVRTSPLSVAWQKITPYDVEGERTT